MIRVSKEILLCELFCYVRKRRRIGTTYRDYAVPAPRRFLCKQIKGNATMDLLTQALSSIGLQKRIEL